MTRPPRGGAAPAVCFALASLALIAGCAQSRETRAPELETPYSELTFDEGVDRFGRDVGDAFGAVGDGFVGFVHFISPFKPAPPINSDRLEIVRQLEPIKPGQQPSATAQHLTIELISGRAYMVDTDGRKYPNEIEIELADRLKALIDSREWHTNSEQARSAPNRNANVPVRYYRMTVYINDEPYKKEGLWVAPSTTELNEPFAIVTQIFTAQHRRAHPLSNRINLLRKPSPFDE